MTGPAEATVLTRRSVGAWIVALILKYHRGSPKASRKFHATSYFRAFQFAGCPSLVFRTPADAAKSARGKGVVEKFLNERGLRILAALDDVGWRYRVSPATVALAWQIARPSITAPIASATTVDQLEELVAATQLNLDQAAVEQLNAASA